MERNAEFEVFGGCPWLYGKSIGIIYNYSPDTVSGFLINIQGGLKHVSFGGV